MLDPSRIHCDPGVEVKKRERCHPSMMVKRWSDLACQKKNRCPSVRPPTGKCLSPLLPCRVVNICTSHVQDPAVEVKKREGSPPPLLSLNPTVPHPLPHLLGRRACHCVVQVCVLNHCIDSMGLGSTVTQASRNARGATPRVSRFTPQYRIRSYSYWEDGLVIV